MRYLQFIAHSAPGFLSQVYRRASRIELSHCGINYIYLKELPLRYKGQVVSPERNTVGVDRRENPTGNGCLIYDYS